ncbi:MAG: YlbF family regulator [Luteolibacter sp.]
MSAIAESSAIVDKTRDLCKSIVEDDHFKSLQGKIEEFLNDDAAKLQYQSVHQRGEELHQKQASGVELSKTEISEFETAREALLENVVVTTFLSAKQELEGLQNMVRQYVGLTLEMGKVPTQEEVDHETGGGCCGGGGGEGCCG